MNNLKLLCIFALIGIIVIMCVQKNFFHDSGHCEREHYEDPIWPNKVKMYNDQYTRSNGSIYGNSCQPWDMFSGFPLYPKAY